MHNAQAATDRFELENNLAINIAELHIQRWGPFFLHAPQNHLFPFNKTSSSNSTQRA